MRLKMISVLFIFAITAAGVVSCGGSKIPPHGVHMSYYFGPQCRLYFPFGPL